MWNIEFVEEGNIVKVITSGTVNMDQIIQIITDALSYGEEKDANKYLFDCRDMDFDSSISTFDLYYLPRDLDKLGGKRPNWVALIVSSENKRNEDFRFLETVFQNRGSQFHIYEKEDEALEWFAYN